MNGAGGKRSKRAKTGRGGRVGVAGVTGSLTGRQGRREQPTRLGDVVSVSAAGEKVVVSNAIEAVRQDMRKRWMNSGAASVIVLSRSRPLMRSFHWNATAPWGSAVSRLLEIAKG